ncbi:MAG: Ca-activated chloride channel [Solirubrobacteraceae bacterium]|jgi:Ca-activated chloride channel family protein|nr:Ca-activated chloride channel [Solirubrobacteraceae bacterium]
MQVNTYADVDVVAVEQDDEVTVMIELTAPSPATDTPRPPAAVQVVLDRSGSMDGERLEAAKQALVRLVDRLDPGDRFGVVAFDDEVRIVVPAGELDDKAAARRAIADLQTGGMTNLSGGLLRGLQEARRVAGDGGCTLLLLSDGHANAGETDPAKLSSVAAGAREHGITTSTVGIGMGYDELLLAGLARGGQGSHVFAEHGDGAAAAVAGEIEGLLSKTVQAAGLLVRPDAAVGTVTVWNDLPGHPVGGGIMVELGDLWAGEQRKLVLTFNVPAKTELGLAQIAELELRYVMLPAFAEQTITIPVCVNVVPGDQAAGRIPDQTVRTELVYQQVQDAKRRAADALRGGDHATARRAYELAGTALDDVLLACPSQEIAEERDVIEQLRTRADAGEADWAAKFSRMDHSRKSRRRGRGDLGM